MRLRSMLCGLLASSVLAVAPVQAAEERAVQMVVPAFLSGPAAGPYGIPSRNAAELLIEAINEGRLPAPYAGKGFAGAKVEVAFIDENGGNAKQVNEFRNLVQKRQVDLVLGYVSSGTCEAVLPVAEELKVLTVFTICGATRLFEGEPRSHVFRTMATGASEAIAAARFIKDAYPDLKSYTGINQNYAWGQDAWNDFQAAMSALSPAKVSAKPLWPKVFQGQFSSEISSLLLGDDELVHSSAWGGDLDGLVLQGDARGLFAKKKVLLTMAGAGAELRLGRKMPDGVVVGARGPFGLLALDRDTPLNRWFIDAYKDRFGTTPPSPAYQTGQGILAVKLAYDRAGEAKGGAFPTKDEVIARLRNLEFDSFAGRVKMALGGGHQAMHEIGYGFTRYDEKAGELKLTGVTFYAPECINPPPGTATEDWIKGGMAGAKC